MSAATDTLDRRAHWEEVYLEKEEPRLSWHQDDPQLSFDLVTKVCPRGGRVLDVGGGTSLLGSRLATSGHAVIVVDLSGAALRRAQERAGAARGQIRWLVADVCGQSWSVDELVDVWHDRAVFHFLTDPDDRRDYVARAARSVRPGGHAVVAAFALDGPEQCSGLQVQRYDARALAAAFGPDFTLVESQREVHTTPWSSQQPFVYAVLQRA